MLIKVIPLLDLHLVKDVSGKWERSNTSPEIYCVYRKQMEATHSSRGAVTAVTPVAHKKVLSPPSMPTGLGRCLQQPTLG